MIITGKLTLTFTASHRAKMRLMYCETFMSDFLMELIQGQDQDREINYEIIRSELQFR